MFTKFHKPNQKPRLVSNEEYKQEIFEVMMQWHLGSYISLNSGWTIFYRKKILDENVILLRK